MVRLLTLILGPVAIVGAAWMVSFPNVGRSNAETAWTSPAEGDASRSAVRNSDDSAGSSLLAACQRQREILTRRLGSGFASVVHRPFILCGDMPAIELERHYRETIALVHRALTIAYFDKAPREPIAIVLLSSDAAYEACAKRLDGHARAAFAGYYERRDRRIVANTATGDGTLAHELTHALAHVDFPDMPEWFDEGLASLHEEARFSDDGSRIRGTPNWRGRYLAAALRRGTLRPLESLIAQAGVRTDQQAVDYAHARYFCLFLQERGLLEAFYRKLRADVGVDPTGLRTLQSLFGADDLAQADTDFRALVRKLENVPTRGTGRGKIDETVRDRGWDSGREITRPAGDALAR